MKHNIGKFSDLDGGKFHFIICSYFFFELYNTVLIMKNYFFEMYISLCYSNFGLQCIMVKKKKKTEVKTWDVARVF